MEKQFVICTLDDKKWSKDNRLLFLSEDYYISARSNGKLENIEQPIILHAEYDYSREKISSFCEKLLDAIYPKLNSYSGESFSEEFWRGLLEHWLNCFCTTVFIKCKEVESLYTYKEVHNVDLEVAIPKLDNDYLNIPDFVMQAYEDSFNANIYARIMEIDRLIAIKYYEKEVSKVSREPAPIQPSHRLFSRVLFRFFMTTFSKNTQVLYFSQKYPQDTVYFLTNRSFGKIKPMSNLENSCKTDMDLDFRNGLEIRLTKEIDCDEWWERCTLKILPQFIPLFFAENFRENLEICQCYLDKFPKLAAIKTITGGIALNNNKLCGALLRENGGLFCGEQHAWGYGFFKGIFDAEKSVYNTYYAWGAFYHDVSKKCIIKHSLVNFSNTIELKKHSGTVLFGGMSLFANRGHAGLKWNKVDYKDYINRRKEFIDNLNEYTLSKVVFRERNETCGINMMNILKETYGERLTFSNNSFSNMNSDIARRNKSFTADLADCELFICDHVSTMYIESLLNDKPTVIVLDKACYCYEKMAVELFDEMAENELLFYSPKEAAQFLNREIGTIDNWWMSSKRQECVNRMIASFATVRSDDKKILLQDYYNLFEMKKVMNDASC